jgi:hypothetical protein
MPGHRTIGHFLLPGRPLRGLVREGAGTGTIKASETKKPSNNHSFEGFFMSRET